MNLPISYKSAAILFGSILVAFVALYFVRSSETPEFTAAPEPYYSDPVAQATPLTVSVTPATQTVSVGENLVLLVSLPEVTPEPASGFSLRVVLPVVQPSPLRFETQGFVISESLANDGWRTVINTIRYDDITSSIIADLSLLSLDPEGAVITPTDVIATLELPTVQPVASGVIKIDESVSEFNLKNKEVFRLVLDDTGYSVVE